MGLTAESTGRGAIDNDLPINRANKVIALAGNPNVGKSTVFNELTGLNQHTGNWPGKTVTNAQGKYVHNGTEYILIDLPGTYSLMAHSAEEEVARNFICFEQPDAVIVVCDATCLERNLNLVLQTIEMTNHVIVCVNLLDEAKKKQIRIDLNRLSHSLGVPVIGTSARDGKGLSQLMEKVESVVKREEQISPVSIRYPLPIEKAIQKIEPSVSNLLNGQCNSRWVALKLLHPDENLFRSMQQFLGFSLLENADIQAAQKEAKEYLASKGIEPDRVEDLMVSGIVLKAEEVCLNSVYFEKKDYHQRDRKIDQVLTDKRTGIPIMILLLAVVFWITLVGANYPSRLLSDGLFWVQERLTGLFRLVNAPDWLHGVLVLGMFRVLAWVVAVMLPPMAIFFPLFTLLEDLGYLPRVAFNLDKYFKKAKACGKQALTMCMGFGCNAAGIVGCRIIDSPRERLIAMITNSFVPCNGRFPTLIAIITMFFAGTFSGPARSVVSTLLLTGVILLGVLMTFLMSRLLSATILKGVPSSFTLELPPYRRPQIGKVIVRSIFDRTLFVLGRAAAVAAPAGILIWLMANISAGDRSLLAHCAAFLDPFGRCLGMDGVILIAFFLGFPANEIVVPIIIMAYMSTGSIAEIDHLMQLKELLTANGWTWLTAVCTMLFSLMHWPCSTTCLTIRKETKSVKWTLISFLVPTVTGMVICGTVAFLARFFGIAV